MGIGHLVVTPDAMAPLLEALNAVGEQRARRNAAAEQIARLVTLHEPTAAASAEGDGSSSSISDIDDAVSQSSVQCETLCTALVYPRAHPHPHPRPCR